MDQTVDLDRLQVDIPKAEDTSGIEEPVKVESTYPGFSIEQISELGNKTVKKQDLRDIQKILRTVYRPENYFQHDTYAENSEKFVADPDD